DADRAGLQPAGHQRAGGDPAAARAGAPAGCRGDRGDGGDAGGGGGGAAADGGEDDREQGGGDAGGGGGDATGVEAAQGGVVDLGKLAVVADLTVFGLCR